MTPALDTLAAEARRWLAEHWDEIEVDNHDRAVVAARRAAHAVTAHPWTAGEPAHPDPHDRLRLVVLAFKELRRLAIVGDSAESLLAAIVVGQVHTEGKLLVTLAETTGDAAVDTAAHRALLETLRNVVAEYLTARPGGLAADARSLERGIRDGDRP